MPLIGQDGSSGGGDLTGAILYSLAVGDRGVVAANVKDRL